LALGRHSQMNGIGIGGGAPPEVVEQQTARLLAFLKTRGGLRDWRSANTSGWRPNSAHSPTFHFGSGSKSGRLADARPRTRSHAC
jgi:hypothetical protein